LIFYLSLGSSPVVFIPRSRHDSRIPLFRVLFIPTERDGEGREREEREREKEGKTENEERRETEARRAFGILTLLFYSPYTLSSHRYRRDLLNHLSTIREMDENRELAREIAVARRAARGRETSSATSSPKLMPDY
jgi:hypothetical protein